MFNVFDIILDEGATKPRKAHDSDAGFDLFSREDAVIKARSYKIFDTGVHINILPGYVGFIKSKSGLNVKHSIVSEGVVDAGYTGSIIVKLYNHGTDDYVVMKGDKISQIVFLELPVIELGQVFEENFGVYTERGTAGFGSTGR